MTAASRDAAAPTAGQPPTDRAARPRRPTAAGRPEECRRPCRGYPASLPAPLGSRIPAGQERPSVTVGRRSPGGTLAARGGSSARCRPASLVLDAVWRVRVCVARRVDSTACVELEQEVWCGTRTVTGAAGDWLQVGGGRDGGAVADSAGTQAKVGAPGRGNVFKTIWLDSRLDSRIRWLEIRGS